MRRRSRAAPTWVLNAFRHHCLRHPTAHAPECPTGAVLNAFRHHCLRHPFTLVPVVAEGSGAQRLSASLLSSRRGWTWLACRSMGAQRLSASLLSSLRSMILRRTIALQVLNAFRHHCFRHRWALPCRRQTIDVLNAFRHHCLRHATGCTRRGTRRVGVLNAFRHHCFRHDPKFAPCSRQQLCSTPFGITACVTRTRSARGGEPGCAQRLSASLLSSQDTA